MKRKYKGESASDSEIIYAPFVQTYPLKDFGYIFINIINSITYQIAIICRCLI